MRHYRSAIVATLVTTVARAASAEPPPVAPGSGEVANPLLVEPAPANPPPPASAAPVQIDARPPPSTEEERAALERGERERLPEFMRKKRRMNDTDLEDKVDGGYFTGLPLVNSDPDTGFGFGARAYYYNNGSKNGPLFKYTPYRQRAYAQGFVTTNGWQYHLVDYDAPYVFDQPYRVKATLAYEKNTAANYFGLGSASLNRLRFPGQDRTYAQYSDYLEAIRQVRPDGTAYTRYDQYVLERPLLTATVERDFFGGIVRGLVGFTASYVNVGQWDGETVSADDAASGRKDFDARQAPTRLAADCASGIAKGCGGGFNNSLKLGVVFDTRDFEPDPNSGALVELTGEFAGTPLGSRFNWARLTLSPRVYYSPFPKLTDLVLAARLVYSAQTEDTPFFEMPQLSFTDLTRAGLGGLRTLRGYKQNRFVGRVAALANFEVRWTFYEFNVGKRQHFGLMLVPFLDVGRVFETIDDFALERFRNSQGMGFRIAWNQATIIVVDYGASREFSSLYINFNHPF